jgi:uncharacterized delta-60 repeat protein
MPRHTSIFEPLESRQLMSGGNLDPSFGRLGLARPNLGFEPTDIAVQSDGKVVLVGNNDSGRTRIARLNADGTLDRSFAGNGLTSVDFGQESCRLNEIAVQRDGKIVAAGTSKKAGVVSTLTGAFSYALARFNTDGTLDRSFSGDGKALLLSGKNMHQVGDMAIQSDGKIVFVGDDSDFHLRHAESDFMVVRVLPDGTLDKGFGALLPGTNQRIGYAQTDMGADDIGSSIAVQRDGKIVVGGTKYKELSTTEFVPGGLNDALQFLVARYLPNGQLDNSFDGNGKLATNMGDAPRLDSIAVQSDGKIVAAGRGNHAAALVRFNLNGSIDSSFSGGKIFTKLTPQEDEANSIFIDKLGAITAVGLTGRQDYNGTGSDLTAIRFSSNGMRDSSFGRGGVAFLASVTSWDSFAATTSDGKIVAAARTEGGATLARFFSDTPRVGLQVLNRKAGEGQVDPDLLTIGRGASYDFPTRVYLNFGGTATLGADYIVSGLQPQAASPTGTSGTLPRDLGVVTRPYVDIPAGRSSVNVPISIVNDRQLEPYETAIFSVVADAAYASSESTATVTIADDDSVRVNFQPASNMTAPGYATDTGAVFGNRGNGLSYGWDADNSANARFRTSSGAPDIRYATYNHMQKNGASRKWEIALPNGLYMVRLVAGDAEATDSVYRMNLEDRLALSGTPSGDVRWFRNTSWVYVSDGRLTLTNASGAMNNKIAFLDIKGAPPSGPTIGDLPVKLYSPATASNWHRNADGLFSDNQIDEPMWK